MKTRYIIVGIFSIFLFTSCTDTSITPPVQESISSTGEIIETSSGSIGSTEVTEEIPEYLKQELDGNSLEFIKVLDDNASYIRYQISYISDSLKISGIMNIPKGAGPFPLLILNHGHIDTSVYTLGRGLKREQDYLAKSGFAVLHTDYRNHAFSDKDELLIGERSLERTKRYGTDSMNAIVAVQEAVKNGVKEVSTINADKVGMLGHSMGGGVTMYSLVSHPELIDAAVLYAPVHMNEFYNFERWMGKRLSIEDTKKLESEIGSVSTPANFLPFSPEQYLSRIEAPIQMYFGSNDESCPVEWGQYMNTAFQNAGIRIQYTEYASERHEFSTKWQDFMQNTAKFYKEELGR